MTYTKGTREAVLAEESPFRNLNVVVREVKDFNVRETHGL